MVGTQRNALWHLDTAFQGQLVKDETFGNGTFANYQYDDQRYWLKTVTTNLGTGHIQGITYTHYNNGLVQDRQDEGRNPRTYAYDNLNRLASITDFPPGGDTNHFDLLYDDQGNVRRHPRGDTFENVDLTYRTDRSRLVNTVTTSAGTNAYGYDANGNVHQRTGPDIPDGAQTIDWTPFDLPQRVANASGTKVTSFEYSADEGRTIQRGPNSTRYYITDLYERVAGASPQDTLEERFRIYAGGRVISEIVRAGGSDQTLYFHADHLGSIDTISTNAVPPQWSHQRFDAFGASVGTPSSLTRASFTGHERDDDLGLIDMKGRVYDPLAGRFLSADPLMQDPFSTQGLNQYSYVFNNPANYVDPSGLKWEWVPYVAGAAIAAIDIATVAYYSGFDLSSVGSSGTLSGIAGNAAGSVASNIEVGGTNALVEHSGGTFGSGSRVPSGAAPTPAQFTQPAPRPWTPISPRVDDAAGVGAWWAWQGAGPPPPSEQAVVLYRYTAGPWKGYFGFTDLHTNGWFEQVDLKEAYGRVLPLERNLGIQVVGGLHTHPSGSLVPPDPNGWDQLLARRHAAELGHDFASYVADEGGRLFRTSLADQATGQVWAELPRWGAYNP